MLPSPIRMSVRAHVEGSSPLSHGFQGYKALPSQKQDPAHILEAIQRFQRQSESDNCEPTCFKNVMDELSSRTGVRKLRRGLRELNRLFDYRKGHFCDSDLGISNLNDILSPLGYNVRKTYGSRSGLNLLSQAIGDERSSYVIAAVSPEYFGEQVFGYKVTGEPHVDHALIVLSTDNQTVSFFDPYENYLKAKRVADIKTKLPLVKFSQHWGNASRPQWMAWVVPAAMPLEAYGGTR